MHSLAIASGILHSVNAESKGKGKPILLSKPETMHTTSVPKKRLRYCSSLPLRLRDLFRESNVDIVAYFNSSKNCSTFSSSDLRKSLTFCAAALSGVYFWPKISEILDEPPPFHARI